MNAYEIAGRIYPAKSGKLELIDHIKEIMNADYQTGLRFAIPRRAMERAIADLEHGVQILDALQDERDKNAATEFASRQQPSPVMSHHDAIALESAQQIMALPGDMPEGQRKALVQCIVLEAMRRVTATPALVGGRTP